MRPRFRNALFRLSAGYRRRIPLAAVAAVLALLAGVLSTPKVAYASTNFYDTTHTIGNFGQYSNSIVDGSLATGNGYVVIATSAAVNVYDTSTTPNNYLGKITGTNCQQDIRVIYDNAHGHWVMSCVAASTQDVWVTVGSNANNPLSASWYHPVMDSTCNLDFPTVVVGSDKLGFAVNNAGASSCQGVASNTTYVEVWQLTGTNGLYNSQDTHQIAQFDNGFNAVPDEAQASTTLYFFRPGFCSQPSTRGANVTGSPPNLGYRGYNVDISYPWFGSSDPDVTVPDTAGPAQDGGRCAARVEYWNGLVAATGTVNCQFSGYQTRSCANLIQFNGLGNQPWTLSYTHTWGYPTYDVTFGNSIMVLNGGTSYTSVVVSACASGNCPSGKDPGIYGGLMPTMYWFNASNNSGGSSPTSPSWTAFSPTSSGVSNMGCTGNTRIGDFYGGSVDPANTSTAWFETSGTTTPNGGSCSTATQILTWVHLP